MQDSSRLHPHHGDAQVGVDDRRRTMALVVLCLCAFTTTVDVTITNVALPFISVDLKASTGDLQWVIDSYNIMLAGLLVLGGGLADRIGRKTVFIAGYTLFGLACLLAAFSSSANMLIAARALMGIGAAGLVAPALAIIATLYKPDERANAIAVWAVFGAAGLAVGPVIGGFLLNQLWWGSVFLVNVPVVAIGVLLGARAVPQSREPEKGHLDVTGALLSVSGLGALLFGIIEGPERGWASPGVLVALAAGVVLTVAFVGRELQLRAPLFDVRILARRAVTAGAVALFVSYVVFTGMLFLLPQYLQESQGQSIISVGLLLVPFAALFGFASTQSKRAMDHFGARTTITAGLGVCSLGMALLALAAQRGLVPTILTSAVVGVGLSGLIAPASTVVMNDLPKNKAGDGSSLNMLSRFVGAAVGVAVVGSVFASVYSSRLADSVGGGTGGAGAVGSLSPSQAATADGSFSGARSVARQLRSTAGKQLAEAARDAFDTAVASGYLVVAGLGLIGAIWAWRALRPAP